MEEEERGEETEEEKGKEEEEEGAVETSKGIEGGKADVTEAEKGKEAKLLKMFVHYPLQCSSNIIGYGPTNYNLGTPTIVK